MLEELLRAGMAVARFNFSHGSYDYHQVLFVFVIRRLCLQSLNSYSYTGNTGQLEDCNEEHPHHVCCDA